jgi:GTP cyclohydrolase I
MKSNGNIILTDKNRADMLYGLESKFTEILEIMGFDLSDQHIVGTPKRLSKMWVNELFSGSYSAEPEITTFENVNNIDDMVFLGNINIKSTCSHHFIPFIGKCFIAYIPDQKLVGISKLARIVRWFMRRPQIQEELVKQIADHIENILQPKGVAVYIEAQHLCMTVRGVEEYDSVMKSSAIRGTFNESACRKEFFDMIKG